jgi:hypothetical protein
MTPKEKAIELYEKYDNYPLTYEWKKQCALIAVDLHLLELSKMKLIFSDREIHYNFWKEVKQEIEKL